MIRLTVLGAAGLICAAFGLAASEAVDRQKEIFWEIDSRGGIVWDLEKETRLPHGDNIEMSGFRVSAIVHYEVDEQKRIRFRRDVIYPQLRVLPKDDESRWQQYRAYLRQEYDDRFLPVISVDGRGFGPGGVKRIEINGLLRVVHDEGRKLSLVRTLLPSQESRAFAEIWQLENRTDQEMHLEIGHVAYERHQQGQLGSYRLSVSCDAPAERVLKAGESLEFTILYRARLEDEPFPDLNADSLRLERGRFLDAVSSALQLETPDPIINRLFSFSKIRAAESIFESSMGLIHSPGGGRYYTGVWANDQGEYSGPFFPYLGYAEGDEAALNAYRVFLTHLPEAGGQFWSSFEMDGTLTCCGSDRGDAAMIAFGAGQFALARGDSAVARELWPLIDWSLEYCDGKRNEAGVIVSDSDEMEGRISTGKANLSTSSLYYGALQQAIVLGKALGLDDGILTRYQIRARDLSASIENHFGAEIDGLLTYRYYEGHGFLRHWICLPLVVGLEARRQDTLTALFDRLWTDNGVRVELNPSLTDPELFWDRGTLYAFRGAFKAGAMDMGLKRLQAFSKTRLLGVHVPYVVEAWPEGNMAHLSAESALYCRIFTEGLLGIEAGGLDRFWICPRLPETWDRLELRHMKAFGGDWTIRLRRRGPELWLDVLDGNRTIHRGRHQSGEKILIKRR